MAKRKQATAKVTTQRKVAKVEGGEDVPPKASLLGIPGEIRNRIYRLALVPVVRHDVSWDDCAEPGLLRTCQQVRKEARSIFCTENKFNLHIHSYYFPINHWIWKGSVSQDDIRYRLEGDAVWSRLKLWLRAYWSGHAWPMRFLYWDDGKDYWIVSRLFKIVGKMKSVP